MPGIIYLVFSSFDQLNFKKYDEFCFVLEGQIVKYVIKYVIILVKHALNSLFLASLHKSCNFGKGRNIKAYSYTLQKFKNIGC